MDYFILVYNYFQVLYYNKNKPSLIGYNIHGLGGMWIYNKGM